MHVYQPLRSRLPLIDSSKVLINLLATCSDLRRAGSCPRLVVVAPPLARLRWRAAATATATKRCVTSVSQNVSCRVRPCKFIARWAYPGGRIERGRETRLRIGRNEHKNRNAPRRVREMLAGPVWSGSPSVTLPRRCHKFSTCKTGCYMAVLYLSTSCL